MSDRTRWDQRWALADGPPGEPSGLLVELADLLPTTGLALDVAAGRGRQARWLAARGLAVTAVDLSPVGLASIGAGVRTLVCDLCREPPPPGPWDLITCVDYLQPELFNTLRASLAPGGWLLFAQATVRNLERHSRPPARFLVQPDAVLALAGDLEIVRCDAAWRDNGRHEAWLAARRG